MSNESATATQQAVDKYYGSWNDGTFDRAKFDEAIDPDVSFRGSIDTLEGAEELAAGVVEFIQVMQSIEFNARLFDGDEAFVLYTVQTGPIGELRLAEHLKVENGKITAINLVFDSYKLRPLLEQVRAQRASA